MPRAPGRRGPAVPTGLVLVLSLGLALPVGAGVVLAEDQRPTFQSSDNWITALSPAERAGLVSRACGSEAEHCPGDKLSPQSLTLLSNTVADGKRTVVLPFHQRTKQTALHTASPVQRAMIPPQMLPKKRPKLYF